MDFSIIIPSRNRPALVRQAIESVLAQRHPEFEVVVVDDGSEGEAAPAYRRLADLDPRRVHVHHLPPTPTGHGPSFAINTGTRLARGAYLAFLDDDDVWTDPEHLARCLRVVRALDPPPDAIYCNQQAVHHDGREAGPLWIEGLLHTPDISPRAVEGFDDVWEVDPAELVRHPGFCHLNTSVIRREHYLSIGGMDDHIVYEGDRDLYLRTIDAAARVIHIDRRVARHHIPDPRRRVNVSTLVDDLHKHLSQLHLLEKARLFARRPEIRRHGRTAKALTLKKIAERLAAERRPREAATYAREALALRFGVKWAAYTGWLHLRALFR